MCLFIKISNILFQIDTNMSNFHPLEVVGSGSETQLRVGENSNYLILRLKRLLVKAILAH